MARVNTIRKLMDNLRYTPFHPQWLAVREEIRLGELVASRSNGLILDIGCGRMWIKRYLKNSEHHYIGMDFFATANEWYRTKPDIYGDGQSIPMASESVNCVLLLNVLEHLPDPAACLAEICRVLKPSGLCIIDVPFLYPIHDAPRDYHRWTRYGLDQACRARGLEIESLVSVGHPFETAALLMNIGVSKVFLNLMERRNPLTIFVVVLPLIVPLVNLLAVALSRSREDIMPHSYRLTVRKV
ncbi:MAG: class I SAM-dependent methyltransferase [Acidiferrobacterales bacterium]